MRRLFSTMAAALLCASAAFAQYTNELENASTQTVSTAWSNDVVRVGGTTSSNAMHVVSGGAVSSTNVYVGAASGADDNAVLVTGTGRWDIENTLEIGAGTNNAVSVGDGGTLSVGNLVLHSNNTFNLDNNGIFAISTNFDASMTGFNWNDGGRLSVGGELTGMAVSNGTVWLDGGRDLTLDGGTWDVSGTNIVVGYGSDGSTLRVTNDGFVSSTNAYIGWNADSAYNMAIVDTGGVWTNSGDLWIGNGSDGNDLWIYDGGTNLVGGSAYIGTADAMNNLARIEGTNSFWGIDGDLAIGGVSNSVGNQLNVADGAAVSVGGNLSLNSRNTIVLDGGDLSIGGDMNVASNATVSGSGTILFGTNDSVLALAGPGIGLSTNIVFDGGSGSNTVRVSDRSFEVTAFTSTQYTNFATLDLRNGTLAGHGSLDAFDQVSMQGGTIDPMGDSAGTLTVSGSFSSSGTVYRAQVFDTAWDQLVFTGADAVDLDGLGLEVYVPLAPTGGVATVLSSAVNLVGTLASTNIDERLLLYTASLQIDGGEVSVVLAPDHGKLSSALDHAATESVRTGFGGMKNTVFTRTKQLRRNLVSTAHSIPREVYLLTSTNAPAGAMGPGDQNTIFDMHVWMQQYSGQGDYDASGATDGFVLNNNGTTIGADKLVGEALAVGLNYTYARSSARADQGDRLDAETYWVGAYAEWVGVDGLYVDALAGYGYSSYDAVRLAKSYRGTAAYNGQAFGAYADVGQYYFHGAGENLALAPYLGLHAMTMVADAHDETEDAGSVVRVGDVDRDWLESALGLKLRHRFDTRIGRFQTTGYAEWTYDFIQDDVSSSLSSSGLVAVDTATVSPDASGINAGLGYSWICTDYMEIGIGYNGRFSDGYEEHTGSVMLDMMF